MSGKGQKRTSHDVRGASALPPITDIRWMERHAWLRLNKAVRKDSPVERSGRRSCHFCSCSPFARSLRIDICLKYLEIPATIQIEILKRECRSSNPAWSASHSCPRRFRVYIARKPGVRGILATGEGSLCPEFDDSSVRRAENLCAASAVFPFSGARSQVEARVIVLAFGMHLD